MSKWMFEMLPERAFRVEAGRMRLFKKDAPAADPAIGQAAAANAEIAKETLDWYKAKDAELAPARDEAIKLALDQARTQAVTSQKQNDMADETYAYTKSTFRPLEEKIAADAQGYDTPERRDAEAAQAQADFGTASNAQELNTMRLASANGIDVNSGNFVDAMAKRGVTNAAVMAGAGNQARKNVETVGAAKLADAANLGRGIASSNATQTQLALSAGNSAVNNAQVPGNIGVQQGNMMNQGNSTAIQGNSSAGNLMLGQYNAQNNARQSDDGLWGAIGNVAGKAAGMGQLFGISDKNQKKDRKPVKPGASLAAIRKMPVDSWKYKGNSRAADGGKTHVGPMAQDVRKGLGDATAPGGKKIDLISMNGHLVNAVKSIDKRLMRLENTKSKR